MPDAPEVQAELAPRNCFLEIFWAYGQQFTPHVASEVYHTAFWLGQQIGHRRFKRAVKAQVGKAPQFDLIKAQHLLDQIVSRLSADGYGLLGAARFAEEGGTLQLSGRLPAVPGDEFKTGEGSADVAICVAWFWRGLSGQLLRDFGWMLIESDRSRAPPATAELGRMHASWNVCVKAQVSGKQGEASAGHWPPPGTGASMTRSPRVFVASPMSELETIRKDVGDLVTRLGYEDIRWETGSVASFTPDTESLVDCALRAVSESDLLVLLLSGKVGFIHPSTKKSATEMEYDAAKERGIHVYAFVRADVHREYLEYFVPNRDHSRETKLRHDLGVHDFIDRMYRETRAEETYIHDFKTSAEITDILIKQWAGLFGSLLRTRPESTDPPRRLGQGSPRPEVVSTLESSELATFVRDCARAAEGTVPEYTELATEVLKAPELRSFLLSVSRLAGVPITVDRLVWDQAAREFQQLRTAFQDAR